MSPSTTTTTTATTKTSSPNRTTKHKNKSKFAEDAGISHLLSLSQSITDATSQLHKSRIDTTKSKIQARRLKKQSDAQRKNDKSTADANKLVKAKTKAEIKAALKAQQREKAKLRKDKRKSNAAHNTDQAAKTPNKPRKSVSFALA